MIFLLISHSHVLAKNYRVGEVIKDVFVLNNKFKLNLPKGNWTLAEKSTFDYYIKTKFLLCLELKTIM